MPHNNVLAPLGALLALALAAVPVAGCDDDGGTDPAPECEAAGDLRCPEAYACYLRCQAGRAAEIDTCMAGCESRVRCASRASASDVSECVEVTCADQAGAALQPCVEADCAQQFAACLDDARTVRNPCPEAEPNALGIGTPCTTLAECEGQTAANCPWAGVPGDSMTPEELEEFDPPKWCNVLCDLDEDCGERAFCWYRRGFSTTLVSSCAMVTCLEE